MRQNLKDELNNISRGMCAFDYPIKSLTSMKMGGYAEAFLSPKDPDELRKVILFAKKHRVRYFILGGGANICVLSKMIKGIVLSLRGSYFKKIEQHRTMICAGAGTSISKLLSFVAKHDLGGLEALAGIPGSVGGAVFMNAGGGREEARGKKKKVFWVSDALLWLMVMGEDGKIEKVTPEKIKFSYRSSRLKGKIILEAAFRLSRRSPGKVAKNIKEHLENKRKIQDLNHPSSGCIFRNPKSQKKSAGQIIDECGLKGYMIGAAQISTKHANFIINKGGAESRDVKCLIAHVKKIVYKKTGVMLKEEVKTI